jgi:hypothetical protein
MFTAAFDAGGHESNQKCVTVAGFLSSANDWIAFSTTWNWRLSQDNVRYFRMSEFAHWGGEFANRAYWTEEKRRGLLDDLLGLIQQHAYRKIGLIVANEAFSAMSDEVKEVFRLNAYVIGARSCAAAVRMWAQREKITSPIEYVFEDGDIGKGKLIERMEIDGFPAPSFRPKKDTIKGGIMIPAFVPLQASDILAYELFQLETKPEHGREWIRKELNVIPGPIRRYLAAGIQALEDDLRLGSEIQNWLETRSTDTQEGLAEQF